MSLLNRPSHGFPSSLVVIYHLLISKGKLGYNQIIALCDPPTLNAKKSENEKDSTPTQYVRKTLKTWCDLGLFQKTGDEVAIAPDVLEEERCLEGLPSAARRVVFSEDNNPSSNFFDNEGAKSSGFIRLLAWSLMQDIWTMNQAGSSEVTSILKQQASGTFSQMLCQNSTRWNGLTSWARFLGFAWSPTHPLNTIELDPTVAIRETLPHIFNLEETLEAEIALDRIAKALPVLDRGEYRKRVEQELPKHSGSEDHAWQKLPEHQISTSQSRALLRLEAQGLLTLEDLADSKNQKLSLTGPKRSEIGKISHITYAPASSIT